ncbi:hypothetical protein Tco_0918608 [Tanacetum coccineum]
MSEKDASLSNKKRGQAPERNKVIQEEVEKLVEARIIKEVHYHSWLSNSVMVKKHDRSWQMCVDFKDLNKAYPQDGYPLPEIDWKLESVCGYPFKCFLDAYKRYHLTSVVKVMLFGHNFYCQSSLCSVEGDFINTLIKASVKAKTVNGER